VSLFFLVQVDFFDALELLLLDVFHKVCAFFLLLVLDLRHLVDLPPSLFDLPKHPLLLHLKQLYSILHFEKVCFFLSSLFF